MREWHLDNGIIVMEEEFYYALHCFSVFYDREKLGVIYPDDIESMNSCISDLDIGIDPITGGWEDGFGGTCSMNGWGAFSKEDEGW